jgi:hypothetical protein
MHRVVKRAQGMPDALEWIAHDLGHPNLTFTALTLRPPSNVPVETAAIDPVLTVIKRANGEHHEAFDRSAGSAASCRNVRSPIGDRNIRRSPGDLQFHVVDDFTISIRTTGR